MRAALGMGANVPDTQDEFNKLSVSPPGSRLPMPIRNRLATRFPSLNPGDPDHLSFEAPFF